MMLRMIMLRRRIKKMIVNVVKKEVEGEDVAENKVEDDDVEDNDIKDEDEDVIKNDNLEEEEIDDIEEGRGGKSITRPPKYIYIYIL